MSTDEIFLKLMFLKMFLPDNSDVLEGLVSKTTYASLLREGTTKEAFKYL